MLFVYLDEFGHVGPFASRTDPIYRESPVFGLAGIILPESSIRVFATKFLQLKEHVLGDDIAKSGKMAQKWEKKGSSIFRPGSVERYPEVRRLGFRLLDAISKSHGHVFYHGREKIRSRTDVNPNGLYTTVFARAIRQLDAYANSHGTNFAIVLDEHSARKELLECAAKTMYGANPTRRLVSPPFEVESYLDQNMQAADWIAAILGRLYAHRCCEAEYADHVNFTRYYWGRLHKIAVQSSLARRLSQSPLRVKEPVAANDAEHKVHSETIRYSILDPTLGASRGNSRRPGRE